MRTVFYRAILIASIFVLNFKTAKSEIDLVKRLKTTNQETSLVPFWAQLYTLQVSSENFGKLKNKRYVFAYAYDGDNLVLKGWRDYNPIKISYADDPEIVLVNSTFPTIERPDQLILGNVILQKRAVKKIKKLIKNKYKLVLFEPFVNEGMLQYKIKMSGKIIKDSESGLSIDPEYTGFETNPSPPKNYGGEY